METTEPKKEITNETLLSKSVEFTNLILKQTDSIRARNAEIWDHMEPTYGNVRLLIDMTDKLDTKFDKLINKVSQLQNQIEKLQSDMDKLKYK